MKYLLIGLFVGIGLGLFAAEYTTIYRLSCNTDKYGWMWTNQKRISQEGFTCRYNEHQQIQRETNLYMIYQNIKLELVY